MALIDNIVLGAIFLLLGSILIGVVASEQYKKTSLSGVTNEVIDITTARLAGNNINASKTFNLANVYSGSDIWKTEYSVCNIVVGAYGNVSTDFTVTTDYAVTNAGVLNLVNTSTTVNSIPNTTYIDYNYCADDYTASSWGRSVLNMIGGLMAVMLLAGAVGLFYQAYKEIK